MTRMDNPSFCLIKLSFSHHHTLHLSAKCPSPFKQSCKELFTLPVRMGKTVLDKTHPTIARRSHHNLAIVNAGGHRPFRPLANSRQNSPLNAFTHTNETGNASRITAKSAGWRIGKSAGGQIVKSAGQKFGKSASWQFGKSVNRH